MAEILVVTFLVGIVVVISMMFMSSAELPREVSENLIANKKATRREVFRSALRIVFIETRRTPLQKRFAESITSAYR